MAFFDDLGKKLSQAGQTAVQKTKEMTEIARINGLVSEEEKKIDNSYYQIGKLYVAVHQHDPADEFAGLIAAIAESGQRIKEYRMQIQEIKGVVRCEKCGAEVAKGVAFCSSCGAVMSKVETVDVNNHNKCDSCGALVEKGMRFCTSCGKPMSPPVVMPGIQAEVSTEPSDKRTCSNCGAALDADVAFCTECGTKI